MLDSPKKTKNPWVHQGPEASSGWSPPGCSLRWTVTFLLASLVKRRIWNGFSPNFHTSKKAHIWCTWCPGRSILLFDTSSWRALFGRFWTGRTRPITTVHLRTEPVTKWQSQGGKLRIGKRKQKHQEWNEWISKEFQEFSLRLIEAIGPEPLVAFQVLRHRKKGPGWQDIHPRQAKSTNHMWFPIGISDSDG